MITIEDRAGDGWLSRALKWLGHYGGLSFVVMIAITVTNLAAGDPSGGPLAWATNVIVIAWFIVFMLHDRWHRGLCERCIRSAPLDPEKTCTRWIFALRWHHLNRPLKIGILIAFVIAMALLGHFGGRTFWAHAAETALLLPLSLVYLAEFEHTRLRPWCPFCRWDEGGDAEVVPGPVQPAVSA